MLRDRKVCFILISIIAILLLAGFTPMKLINTQMPDGLLKGYYDVYFSSYEGGGIKVKVAMELIREKESVSAICSRYSVHPTQAKRWRDKALEAIASGFNNKSAAAEQKQKDE